MKSSQVLHSHNLVEGVSRKRNQPPPPPPLFPPRGASPHQQVAASSHLGTFPAQMMTTISKTRPEEKFLLNSMRVLYDHNITLSQAFPEISLDSPISTKIFQLHPLRRYRLHTSLPEIQSKSTVNSYKNQY